MNFQFHTNSTQQPQTTLSPSVSTPSTQQSSSSNNNTLVMLTKSFANTIVTELKK
jgi:hypothetical protein